MNKGYVHHNHRDICREVVAGVNGRRQGMGALNWAILATCAGIIVVGVKIGLKWVV